MSRRLPDPSTDITARCDEIARCRDLISGDLIQRGSPMEKTSEIDRSAYKSVTTPIASALLDDGAEVTSRTVSESHATKRVVVRPSVEEAGLVELSIRYSFGGGYMALTPDQARHVAQRLLDAAAGVEAVQ